jgi:hypothetical protein
MIKTIRVEQMYPERNYITSLKYATCGRTMSELTEFINSDLERRMPKLVESNPEMTELRWSYGDDQGHYIRVTADDHEPPYAWIGTLNYSQMIDVLKRATELNDWSMTEMVSYQLRLNQDTLMDSSWATFELPFDYYKFDWMNSDDVPTEPKDAGRFSYGDDAYDHE